jgi:hypothetical protein
MEEYKHRKGGKEQPIKYLMKYLLCLSMVYAKKIGSTSPLFQSAPKRHSRVFCIISTAFQSITKREFFCHFLVIILLSRGGVKVA